MKSNAEKLQGLLNTKPVSVKIDTSSLDQLSSLGLDNGELLMFRSQVPVDIAGWIAKNKPMVEETFLRSGALLFRGFRLEGISSFNEFTSFLSRELLDYTEPSTPRLKVADKIYTSTEYPEDQFIPMHNEHSYSDHWPQRIWFYCMKPAGEGGATPISDSRRVFEIIDPEIRDEFVRKKVMYVRNFSEVMDLSWKNVFQTENKREVEEYCNRAGIQFEWKEDGNLRTKQICQAVLSHPRTGECVWFNQAHLFHISSLPLAIQTWLIGQYGELNVPRNCFFGDGTSIPVTYLDEIRDAYHKTQLVFDWQPSDILMLDNMLFAHGRYPFKGERKVLVAMADVFSDTYKGAIPTLPGDAAERSISKVRHATADFFTKSTADKFDPQILKYELAAACRMMVAESLDEGGISGHITLRVPGRPEAFWVNPFGLLAEEVTAENLLMVDKMGNVLEGDHPVNVAGFCIHAAIHAARPEVNCVVHTHSPWGTLFSALDRKIEPIDQNCCLFFENHTLFGQYDGPVNDVRDAFELAKALGSTDVMILRNHGTITCGNLIEAAVMRMVSIERAYRLNILAMQLHEEVNLIDEVIARSARFWIGNDIGFSIEFNALLRKIERIYPEFKSLRPKNFKH
jgi:ribulose-5-phosphate 4-epimerase/fuculose-1-phosphate aldolase/alpha-ketoglutarate-dependent taurine dioxygenase